MRRPLRRMRDDSGTGTVEYALVTLVAAALAAVLLKVVTSGPVEHALSRIIERALQ